MEEEQKKVVVPVEKPVIEEPKSTPMIDAANAAADRLEAANKRQEELLKKQETLQVNNMLGGKAEAGTEQKEETPKDYIDRVEKEGFPEKA